MVFTVTASRPIWGLTTEGLDTEVFWTHTYWTIEETAVAVARFVLDAIPPSRNPIDTSVAERVLTWDGKGQLTFTLSNRTEVVVTKHDLIPMLSCVFCGGECSGRYDKDGHREGYCLKCGRTQPNGDDS